MSNKRMRICSSCCRTLNTDLMYYDWGEWRCNNSNVQNVAECNWINTFDSPFNDSIPDFSNEQIARDFYVQDIVPSYIIQRWIVMAFRWKYPSLDGFTIGMLEKVMPIDKVQFIDELNTMISLGEIDKKGFRYSIGKTYAEINERVSKLEQKYQGIIEAGDCQ